MSDGRDPAVTADSADLVLESKGLSVAYGKITALSDVDITVRRGELVSIIGPNGAGKTTFADTVMGFLDYEGSLTFQGEEVRARSQSDLVASGMIYCTEERDLFAYMTVEQNLRLGAYRSRDTIADRLAEVYDLFPRLEERRSQNARTMSGGEQQMLAIGRALMGDPEFLILDEPTLGLAPVIVDDISKALERILAAGVTVLLTEQNVVFAMDHADRIYLLENGRLVRSGSVDEIQGDDYIQNTYLGG
jgi:branched-chain amino acid transport system ATP-binding protein